MNGQCDACLRHDVLDRAHIRSRGAGGGWDDDNIMYFCRKCHQLQHQYGWHRFSCANPRVKSILAEKGWEFQELFGVMKLVKKE